MYVSTIQKSRQRNFVIQTLPMQTIETTLQIGTDNTSQQSQDECNLTSEKLSLMLENYSLSEKLSLIPPVAFFVPWTFCQKRTGVTKKGIFNFWTFTLPFTWHIWAFQFSLTKKIRYIMKLLLSLNYIQLIFFQMHIVKHDEWRWKEWWTRYYFYTCILEI
jgi:hypothetical protein